MKIKHSDIERGFQAGIQFCHAVSKNWRQRVSLGKLARKLETQTKDIIQEKNDIVYLYIKGDVKNEVKEEELTLKDRVAWREAIAAWREGEIEIDPESVSKDLIVKDGLLEIKLGAISLRSIPHNFMEAIVGYVAFDEDPNQTKEEDHDAQVRKLQEELDKLKNKK